MIHGKYEVVGMFKIPMKFIQLAMHRVTPLMTFNAMQTLTLNQMLAEAYMNGLKDSADALQFRHEEYEEGLGI